MDEMTNPFEEGSTLGAAVSFITAAVAAAVYGLRKLDLRVVKGGSDLVEQQQTANHETRRAVEEIIKRLDDIEANQQAIMLRDERLDTSLEHAWERVKTIETRLDQIIGQ